MEFTVDTIQFANVAKVVIKGLDMKDEVSQALLKLDGDKLIIQCTSQTTFFKGEIPVSHVNKEDNEVTEWAVDGKQLTTILSILPSFPMDAKFTMSSSNRQFNITTRNGKFKLPVNDHVIEYNMEDVTVLSEIDSTEFMKNFTRASKFLDSEPLSTASATSCLHLIFDDKIKMVGTNGFSLVEIAVEHDLKVDSDDTPIVLLRSNQLNLLANAFEAVTGAIYLEKGYEFAEKFISKHILVKLDKIIEEGSWRDPKSHLQEVSQRIDNLTPQYKVLDEIGPDHDKLFTIGVFVGEKMMGKGCGPSKQLGQQQAARAALKLYNDISNAS